MVTEAERNSPIDTRPADYNAWRGDCRGTVCHSILEGLIMEQTVFIICMFFGVTSVALIALTLLGIVLGRIKA